MSQRNLGLKGIVITFCVALVLGTVGVLSAALIWQNYSQALSETNSRALIVAKSLSIIAEPGVLLNDKMALDRMVHAAAGDEMVVLTQVYDVEGQLLSEHSNAGSDPVTDFNKDRYTGARTEPLPGDVTQSGSYLSVIVPIRQTGASMDLEILDDEDTGDSGQQSVVGFVRQVYSLQRLKDQLATHILWSIVISAIIVVAGSALAVAMTQKLLNPVDDLVRTSAAIAEGDLTRRASEQAVAEIGVLAKAFNHMASSLEESHASIERKVKERTAELEEERGKLKSEISERQRAEAYLRSTDERLRRQSSALVSLARSEVLYAGNLEAALQLITETSARTLEVERVSVWIKEETRGVAVCLDRFMLTSGLHFSGEELTQEEYKAHAARVEEGTVIVANDCHVHPETCELSDGLLKPRGINSVMNAPIRVGAKVLGGVCHAHVGPARRWTLDEESFASSIADMVTLAMEASDRKRAEAELQLAKEAAEAANLAKSEFLANMSHEIRTPMTAILGFAESLQTDDLAESDRADAVSTICRNGEHLLAIINDILDLSKVEAGRMSTERAKCKIASLLEEVRSLMQVRAEAKGLSLDVDFASAIPSVIYTDGMRLKQILINLIGNAIKFTELGGVRLVVRMDEMMASESGGRDARPQLCFDVVDSGIGIDANHFPSLFEPFQQADTSMTRKFGGTGLGLAISKRLAQELGGDISVISTLNEGSMFTLSIEVGDLEGVQWIDHYEAMAVPSIKKDLSRDEAGDLRDCRVLLVEDGPDNQRLISFVLNKAGAQVEIAENGEIGVSKAIEASEAGLPFDVILMDMQMPVMDGYEATRALRERGYVYPIVALTAHAMEGEREKCVQAGCCDYLAKPIDRAKVIETIRSLLKSRDCVQSDEA